MDYSLNKYGPYGTEYGPLFFVLLAVGLLALAFGLAYLKIYLNRGLGGQEKKEIDQEPFIITADLQKTLEALSHYYRSLDYELKRKFENRLHEFVSDKRFFAREMEGPSDLMMLSVGAAAVQISFGLDDYMFPNFRSVILYPDTFEGFGADEDDVKRRGEVNTLGAIRLSWKHLVSGFLDATDGVNLGLHEFAHALHVENLVPNDEYFFLDRKELMNWFRLSRVEVLNIREGQNSLFRKYAATNMDEMFAVSIEYFFEQPHDFAQLHTELFNSMQRLLQQDPRSANNPVLYN